jgi:hypothetical protein
MHCTFCQQWNPADASDCAYCGNLLLGAVDETIEGRPAYEGGAAGRGASIDRKAAVLVHAREPEPPPLISQGTLQGIVDVLTGRHRTIMTLVGTLILLFIAYKLVEC